MGKHKKSEFQPHDPGRVYSDGDKVVDALGYFYEFRLSTHIPNYVGCYGVDARDVEDDLATFGTLSCIVAAAPPRECPCGIFRQDCEYHGPIEGEFIDDE